MCKKREWLFLTALIIAAALCRAWLLTRDLEYDEIWSLINYSGRSYREIFSDLATPNNHPANTLLIKCLYFSRESAWMIRLGSLFFSLGTVLLLYFLGKAFYRRTGAWYAALAGAFLPPLIVAGVTARGYAGQTFFLLLCALSLIKCRKGSLYWSITAAASGIAATVFLPTTILYLLPLGMISVIYLAGKKRLLPAHYITFSLAAVITALWYGINFDAFRQSRQFQEVINSFAAFYQWLTKALSYNAVYPVLLIPAWFWCRRKKLYFTLLSIIVFPLLMAIFTAPAPGRVYLPGIAAAILLMTPGWQLKKFRIAAATLILAAQFAASYKILPDNRVNNEMTAYDKAQGIITVYGANESFPVSWNHPRSVEIFFRQLIAASTMDNIMLLTAEKNISGVNRAGATVFLDIKDNYHGLFGQEPPYLLRLQRTSVIKPDSTAFALLPPAPAAVTSAKIKLLQARELIFLNGWHTIPLTAADGSLCRFALAAFTTDKEHTYPKELPIFVPAIEK